MRRRFNEVLWKKRIMECARSGLTAQRWCQKEKISYGHFLRVRRQLTPRVEGFKKNNFIELKRPSTSLLENFPFLLLKFVLKVFI